MKVAIYSPYLDTFGGGERYMMTIAETLSRNKFEVDVILDKHLETLGLLYLKNQFTKIFDLDFGKTNFTPGPMGKGSNFLARIIFLKKYDLLFYLTDGSIFYPTAKKNILHIQSPILGEQSKTLWGKFKLKGWDLIIYNSEFTRKNSKSNWPITSEVIYPPVDIDKINCRTVQLRGIKPLKKKKYILSVGRFFGYLKNKKQEVLIRAFRVLDQKGLIKDWSLHLVGSAGEGDKKYLDELRNLAKGIPVKFYPNLQYDDLINLYGQSSIYWHAAGFGEEDPTKMEHFGISTVEAMAAGCVPIVVNCGGQIEIVENEKTGFLWDSIKDLERFTTLLVDNPSLRSKLAQNASLASHKFSKIRFAEKINKLIKN